ncbi:hypothetical protein [Actinomadura oligospora]|uniref:hypothetical protein n=1 Tax=Actinomadura oligospora TaxID=111804 RepID=UPI00047DF3C8|nr:hypothetical protein [Actinomadura oligospora]
MRLGKSARRAFCATAVAAAALGLAAAPAQARQAMPTDEIPTFDYADCPPLPPGTTPSGSFCFEAIASSGSVTIGNVTHVIDTPLKLTFGSPWSDETGPSQVFGALRAERFQVATRHGEPVYAQPEYAGAFEFTQSLGLNLSFKIRFTGEDLGSHCTVGTDSDPISVHLTTGTTTPPPPYQPISGVPWSRVAPGVRAGTVVDNNFPVPTATGCSDNGNAFLNKLGGLPSPAGVSTVILPMHVGMISYSNLP